MIGTRRRRPRLTVVSALLGACLVSALSSASALAAGAPLVDEESASAVGFTGATLEAQINPQEVATVYRFEYGTSVAYGTSVPVPDASIGSGASDVGVSQLAAGLRPGTAYHYRVVASSAEGTTDGADQVLRTYPSVSRAPDTCPNAGIRAVQFSSYLPDCRAYELVSPVAKNGGNVATTLTQSQSAADGSAIKFLSASAFDDATGSAYVGSEYVSQRSPDGSGWSTHGITPPVGSVPDISSSSNYQAFTEDLSRGVYFARKPILAGHPNVELVSNLYLRDDVLNASSASYQLLSDASTPQPVVEPIPFPPPIGLMGASADLSHIIFRTLRDLTPEAEGLSTGIAKLYEWQGGVVRLASVLPDGTPAEVPVGSVGSAHISAAHISADGSRVVFEAGNVYMRVNGSQTVQLNVGERSESESPRGAKYWGATPDGSKVFFASSAKLTDDAIAEENEPTRLYMYDVNAPEGKHLTLISVNSSGHTGGSAPSAFGLPNQGVSEDGSFVYFLSRKDLLPGDSAELPGDTDQYLYVWHNGALRFVVGAEQNSGRDPDWGETEAADLSFRFRPGSSFRVTSGGHRIVFLSHISSTSARAGVNIKANAHAGKVCTEGAGGEDGFCDELFVYDYDTNRVTCVSCSPSGAAPIGPPTFEAFSDIVPGGASATQYKTRVFSGDGRFVFFDSSNALLPQDTNGKFDVYEYDTTNGELRLISSGTSNEDSLFADASGDGSNVFFTTRQRLVQEDPDTQADLYDARVDGGIPAQNVAPPVPCEGDDCQGPAGGAPVLSLPASATFQGVGNAPRAISTPVPKPKSKGKKHRRHRKSRRRGRRSAGKSSRRTAR